jgi:hypothetical protein
MATKLPTAGSSNKVGTAKSSEDVLMMIQGAQEEFFYLFGSQILSWLVTTYPFSRLILHSLCTFSSTELVDCQKKTTKVFFNWIRNQETYLKWYKLGDSDEKKGKFHIKERYVRYLRKHGVDVSVKVEGDAEED